MKKLLTLFVILDIIFVGLILQVLSKPKLQNIERNVATTDTPAKESIYDNLTAGQKNKWQLIETFKFEITASSVALRTDKLQMICETSTSIELQFSAQNIAVAGTPPIISHTYFCDSIGEDQARNTLLTALVDFRKIQQQKKISLVGSELKGQQIYSDEEFPSRWKLTAVAVRGPNNFTINEYEIEKVLAASFDFELPISAK